MKDFVRMVATLDASTATLAKIEALRSYFARAPARDAVRALAVLLGKRPRRTITPRLMMEWMAEFTELPFFLVEESYHHVGDMGETIALLATSREGTREESPLPLGEYWETVYQGLIALYEEGQKKRLFELWAHSPYWEVFLLTKFIGGSLRLGASKSLVLRAVAEALEVSLPFVQQRLAGNWTATEELWLELEEGKSSIGGFDLTQPFPFFLASPLERDAAELGPVEDWIFEDKWDGIRGQLILRQGQLSLWSRGEDMVNEQFPDVLDAARAELRDDCVLDGEILAWDVEAGLPLPFAALQRRLGRKKVTEAVRGEVPIRFVAYDLLEWKGEDLRTRPLAERRALLEQALAFGPAAAGAPLRDDPKFAIGLSTALAFATWEEAAAHRARARDLRVEGLILKKKDSVYEIGRKRGSWWKWKIEPYTIDAVLLYAQPGHGRRSNLMTDYTFAVWRGEELVPIAKAYSGLTDPEIHELDAWIRRHTKERFGPVRSLKPEWVFELAFEGITESKRHKAGLALRFPRIHRWRRDKSIREANTIDDVQELLDAAG